MQPKRPSPLYSLHLGLNAWELVFAGRRSVLADEKGLACVAYLLLHAPGKPIHALELALASAAAFGREKTGTEGRPWLPHDAKMVQQRAASWDDAETARNLARKCRELEAILDNEDETEPVKAEAARELEVIEQFQNKAISRTRDSAQRTVDAVRQSIARLHRRLARAVNASGRPHPVLRPFAQHLFEHLLLPSGRGTRGGRNGATWGQPGCFVYRPPEGVRWESES